MPLIYTTGVGAGTVEAGDISLADGKVLVGNGSNIAAAVSLSGGLTIDNAGVATLAGAPSFTAVTVTNTSNQLVLGTTRTLTLTAPTPASSSRVVTLPDPGGADSVAYLALAQTLSSKTLATPIFTTSMTGPLLIGGTDVSSTLALRSTSGVGSSDAILFQVGNNGATEAGRITTAGMWLINDTTNADMTVGLTINQGAADNHILTLKSSDVAHGMTSLTETDTYGGFTKGHATEGGLGIAAFSGGQIGLISRPSTTTGNTTKSTAGTGIITLGGWLKSGTSSNTPSGITADTNILAVQDGSTTRFILDCDGDSHQDVGTAWTNFDGHDDVALLHALSAGVSRDDDPLREEFGRYLDENREALEGGKFVTFNEDGHHFVNWSRTKMLMIGAIRQLGQRLERYESRIHELESALGGRQLLSEG